MVAVNMPLQTERKNQEPEGYKHVAPPEPEPRHNEDHFSGKAPWTFDNGALQRSAMCFCGFLLHAAPDGADEIQADGL